MQSGKSAVLADVVYEKIKELLLRQQIRCGEKIQEQALEEMLGVSRTPVREAVRKLSNEGIVTLYPNRHAEVICFDEDSIRDLGIVRISMDCLAAQLAIYNGSNKDFAQIRDLAVACQSAHEKGELYEQVQFDSQFHLKLAELSKNGVIVDIQKKLTFRTQLLQITLIGDTKSKVCDVQYHDDIIAGLYERNIEKAVQAILNHLCPFYHIDPSQVKTLSFPM